MEAKQGDIADYRILTADRRIKFAGTDEPSWLNLSDAKSKVEKGEMIYLYCMKTMQPLWEVL